MHPEQERRESFPSAPKTGKGFRAAGSGGMHPGGNAGRKQHAQGTCHLKRKARIKPQGKFFLPHQADKDEQGSQQQPGSRNIVFIGHARRKSQNSRSGKLSPAIVSSGISLSPGFRVFQQTAVQTQKAQPDGGAPGIVGGSGEPVNRDAGPGRAREQQEKPQSEQTHVRPGTGIHPAPGSQIKHHQRKTDLHKGVEQHEEPFSRRRYGKGQVFPDSGIPGHVGGYAALPDQAEREAVLHARQGIWYVSEVRGLHQLSSAVYNKATAVSAQNHTLDVRGDIISSDPVSFSAEREADPDLPRPE